MSETAEAFKPAPEPVMMSNQSSNPSVAPTLQSAAGAYIRAGTTHSPIGGATPITRLNDVPLHYS